MARQNQVETVCNNTKRSLEQGVPSFSEVFLGTSEKKHVLQDAGEKSIQQVPVWKTNNIFFLTELSKQG